MIPGVERASRAHTNSQTATTTPGQSARPPDRGRITRSILAGLQATSKNLTVAAECARCETGASLMRRRPMTGTVSMADRRLRPRSSIAANLQEACATSTFSSSHPLDKPRRSSRTQYRDEPQGGGSDSAQMTRMPSRSTWRDAQTSFSSATSLAATACHPSYPL